MKAARLASWHYSRLLVTSVSEEGASKQRGPLGMRDAAASPLLPSIHRYCVFDSLAFLLLSVVRVFNVCARPDTDSQFLSVGSADRRVQE